MHLSKSCARSEHCKSPIGRARCAVLYVLYCYRAILLGRARCAIRVSLLARLRLCVRNHLQPAALLCGVRAGWYVYVYGSWWATAVMHGACVCSTWRHASQEYFTEQIRAHTDAMAAEHAKVPHGHHSHVQGPAHTYTCHMRTAHPHMWRSAPYLPALHTSCDTSCHDILWRTCNLSGWNS